MSETELLELTPEDELELSEASSKVLLLACGALAREIIDLFRQFDAKQCDIRCLPAKLHNTPQLIPNLVAEKLTEYSSQYERIFVAYADCGTGGQLDKVLEGFPNAVRLAGAHCYATYAGQVDFAQLMEEELGSFFLTDYIVRQFDQLIIKGMGLDRHPQLRDMYFGNYRRVVYLAQTEDADLQEAAQAAADQLGLEYEYRYTGMGELAQFIAEAQSVNV